ncbi:MAG: hypothetical protein M5U19_22130 [Microthrixaceae bacterium]|nr:hypothetical protein [Microthrixaceae bacterium]
MDHPGMLDLELDAREIGDSEQNGFQITTGAESCDHRVEGMQLPSGADHTQHRPVTVEEPATHAALLPCAARGKHPHRELDQGGCSRADEGLLSVIEDTVRDACRRSDVVGVHHVEHGSSEQLFGSEPQQLLRTRACPDHLQVGIEKHESDREQLPERPVGE